MKNEAWLNIKQAARYLNVHPETVRRMIRSNKIRATKWDKDWRIDAKFLYNFVNSFSNMKPGRSNK